MTFSKALILLKEGKWIAREGWNGKGQHLELATNISFDDSNGERQFATHETMGSKAICFVGTLGIQIGWLATQSDMLSDDWVEVF